MVVVPACKAATKSASLETQPCVSPSPGIGPDATATVQDADNGKTVCLHDGDVLTVFLHADPNADRWAPIAASGSDILEARSTGVMTLVRGVTAAIFAVHGHGVATLSSNSTGCTSGSSCATKTWLVKLVVR
jgi:hypothetical protein